MFDGLIATVIFKQRKQTNMKPTRHPPTESSAARKSAPPDRPTDKRLDNRSEFWVQPQKRKHLVKRAILLVAVMLLLTVQSPTPLGAADGFAVLGASTVISAGVFGQGDPLRTWTFRGPRCVGLAPGLALQRSSSPFIGGGHANDIKLPQIQLSKTDIRTGVQFDEGVDFEVHVHCIINSNVSPVGSIV
jgi:hypothetical protein